VADARPTSCRACPAQASRIAGSRDQSGKRDIDFHESTNRRSVSADFLAMTDAAQTNPKPTPYRAIDTALWVSRGQCAEVRPG
jgi:hypothetical protein